VGAASALSKSEQTRERVLTAAADVFNERGFSNTRLSDIAERAGMQAGSLYYHFESKEDLMRTLVERAVERIYLAVRQQVDEVPRDEPMRRLEVAIDAHIRAALADEGAGGATVRMYGQIPTDVNHLLRPLYDDITKFWRGLVSEAQRQGVFTTDVSAEVGALLILGSLNWSTAWYRPGKHSVDRIVRNAQRLLLGDTGA
jgi:AcrR family transcriptional regulator